MVSLQAPLLGVDEPLERAALNVDQVGDVETILQPRETAAKTGGINTCQDSGSFEMVAADERGAPKRDRSE